MTFYALLAFAYPFQLPDAPMLTSFTKPHKRTWISSCSSESLLHTTILRVLSSVGLIRRSSFNNVSNCSQSAGKTHNEWSTSKPFLLYAIRCGHWVRAETESAMKFQLVVVVD